VHWQVHGVAPAVLARQLSCTPEWPVIELAVAMRLLRGEVVRLQREGEA
jgi:hypothetical protein